MFVNRCSCKCLYRKSLVIKIVLFRATSFFLLPILQSNPFSISSPYRDPLLLYFILCF